MPEMYCEHCLGHVFRFCRRKVMYDYEYIYGHDIVEERRYYSDGKSCGSV